MGYSRVIGLVVGLAAVLGGVFYLKGKSQNASTASSNEPLRILTWSNYYPEPLLKEFTAKTGIKVELSYMSSNEELFAKLRAGATGFDLIQPSDYMVHRLIKLEMVKPMDHRQLPNLTHIDDYYKNAAYDSGLHYSVPFTWGTTGIAVNTAKVKVPAEGISWKFLFQSPDPKHTSLLDDMRELFGAYFLTQGKSLNSSDKATMSEAVQGLGKIKNSVLTFNSEPKALLLKGEVSIAHIFSCDANQASKENPAIRYFIPKEGGTIWTDNFAIPKSAKQVEGAHAFINFFLEPTNAIRLIRENQLATPNKTVKAMLTPEESGDPNIYPTQEVLKKLEFFQDLGETLPEMNRFWTELKS